MKSVFRSRGAKVIAAKHSIRRGGNLKQIWDPVKSTFTPAFQRIHGIRRYIFNLMGEPVLEEPLNRKPPMKVPRNKKPPVPAISSGYPGPELQTPILETESNQSIVSGKSINGDLKHIVKKSRTMASEIARVLKGGTLKQL